MSIEVVDRSKTYEVSHPLGAKFTFKHWDVDMQEETDKRCMVVENGVVTGYKLGVEREMKVELAVVGWAGITENGQEIPCTPENKRKLPIGVTLWLVREIDERAGLRMTEQEKKS